MVPAFRKLEYEYFGQQMVFQNESSADSFS
jgi:hypothetical protein